MTEVKRRTGHVGTTPAIEKKSQPVLAKKQAVAPAASPKSSQRDGLSAPVKGSLVARSESVSQTLAPGGESPARTHFDRLVHDLLPAATDTTRAPAGTSTKPIRGAGVSLIGLPNSFFDPKASYADNLARLKQQGVPRFEMLTSTERAYETAFADAVQADPEHFVAGAELLAHDERLAADVFEVDAMKRLSPGYGTGKKPADATEFGVRAESNHALHPTAVAVARLAFLKKLDALMTLPDSDPKKAVFVTSGGVAAGKGELAGIVKRQLSDIPFGVVWDAAGEGDALENSWVLAASRSRGIKTVFGFADNDAKEKYRDVLERGAISGRVPDVMTYAKSYVEGAKNMRAFLESPEYVAAHQAGDATAIGVYAGRFDKASIEDHSLPAFPDSKVLGDNGLIGPADVPDEPDTATVLEASLGQLERYLAEMKQAGESFEVLVGASLGLARKFEAEIP